MRTAEHFPADYRDSRARFLAAHREAGARLEEQRNPAQAPDGNPVFTDLAWLGPPPAEAERVLVTLSGTHGVEGFPGAGVQVGLVERGLADERPAGVALLQVHAVNPHGYAWLRRVTEGNVDLNRNFVDHDAPYPENPGYEELHPWLCPREWNEQALAESDRAMQAFVEEHGAEALNRAITTGQYNHPDGIFFGGHAPTWSNRMLLEALPRWLAGTRQVVAVDLHTGLGPYGHGERIIIHGPGSDAWERACQMWADDVTSPELGTSAAVQIHGPSLPALEAALPNAAFVGCALEFGTHGSPQVRRAIRADNWLHQHGELNSETGRAIKAEIRRAFYPDADDWRDMVWERAVDTITRAWHALAEG